VNFFSFAFRHTIINPVRLELEVNEKFASESRAIDKWFSHFLSPRHR
jgi:hypothetical protein